MPPRSPNRKSRLQSSTTNQMGQRSDSGGIDIPLNWLKSGIGVLLLPCCIIATQSFLSAFGETSAKTLLIRSAEIWFFFIGVLLWLIYFIGLPRPLYLYVLGHELTHANDFRESICSSITHGKQRRIPQFCDCIHHHGYT